MITFISIQYLYSLIITCSRKFLQMTTFVHDAIDSATLRSSKINFKVNYEINCISYHEIFHKYFNLRKAYYTWKTIQKYQGINETKSIFEKQKNKDCFSHSNLMLGFYVYIIYNFKTSDMTKVVILSHIKFNFNQMDLFSLIKNKRKKG